MINPMSTTVKDRLTHWQDRPVFVTGGAGLVGGWLVDHLLGLGAEVVCLVRDRSPKSRLMTRHMGRVTMVDGDVCDQQLMERVIGEYEIRTVFHLAAQTIVKTAANNPVSTWRSNIEGTWSVLEACRRSPGLEAVVVASSDKAYGEATELPYDESTPLNPLYPYDVSKACTDLIARSYAKTYKTPVAITRCGNFYGGGDLNFNRIVPGTIRSILRGEAPVIRSDGTFVRDYFYVEDGAAAYTRLAEAVAVDPQTHGHAFNFSNEDRVNVLGLVEKILESMQSRLEPLVLGQASGEIKEQALSSQFAREALDWSPRFSLDQGLDRTIAWYRDFFGVRRPVEKRARRRGRGVEGWFRTRLAREQLEEG